MAQTESDPNKKIINTMVLASSNYSTLKERFTNRWLLLVLATCVHFYLKAEVIPAERSRLNYTTVYFEEDVFTGAYSYELDLFSDSLLTQNLKKISAPLPAFWIEDLSWASRYYWKVSVYDQKHQLLHSSAIHTFSIMKIVYQSYDEVRMDVIKNNKEKQSGGLISLDYTRSIYDRDGKPVWTIPQVEGIDTKNTHIRDLRITDNNTITFLTLRVPYEIDFNGKLVWQAPFPFTFNGDTVVYHHDFKRTKRGTYMVLAERKVYRLLTGTFTEEAFKNEFGAVKIDGVNYKQALVSVLLEFDKAGKVIWYWDANDYIVDVDFNYKKNPNGISDLSTHANAFSENEAGTKVYVGFRDLSRLVKIDKKTKKVELSYGERYPSGEALIPVQMFNQHDANVTAHNSIYVFNNNGLKNTEGFSSILELKDNVKMNDSALLWKFDLNFDTLSTGKSVNGGNSVELSPTNLLFCAGALNRVFEITKNKEIVWDAFLYSRGINETVWLPFVQYRANWIKQLNWPHFIIENEKADKNAETDVQIKISNTGNCDDSYEISVFSEKNELLQKINTQVVSKGGSYSETLTLNKRVIKAHKRAGSEKKIRIYVKSLQSQEIKLLKMQC